MIYRTKVRHDAFTFSLAGMPTMASVIAPPIVASDRLTTAVEARIKAGASAGPAPREGAGEPRLSWFRRVGCRFAWSNDS